MIDVTKKKPIRVKTGGTAGAYFDVPVSQLDDVRRLLDAHRFRYSVADSYLSFNGGPEQALVHPPIAATCPTRSATFNGGPEQALVHLGWGGDAIAVQKLLDDTE